MRRVFPDSPAILGAMPNSAAGWFGLMVFIPFALVYSARRGVKDAREYADAGIISEAELQRSLRQAWWMERLAVVAGVGCLVALLVVLAL